MPGVRKETNLAGTLTDQIKIVADRLGSAPRVALVVMHDGGAEMALLDEGQPLVVGRGPPAELIVAQRKLSRTHARFTLTGDHVLVEDLGSTNGTWRAGARIDRATIRPGDQVRLGGALALICLLGQAEGRNEAGGVHREKLVAGPAMRALLETIQRVAASPFPVMLRGETGTGKEVIARLIHEASNRREGPMICINCGAIPAQLVESTLFGHERGAFTGATQQQRGVFESANRGTVLLDEIGELPPPAQAALLRVLETGKFARVGAVREIQVDVRVIAATHRDLEAMIQTERFRADLYYRLSTVTLEIPPLRDRSEDVAPLAEHFLEVACALIGRQIRGIAPEALDLLQRHRWPGNVRELRNAIEHAVVVTQHDVIVPEDLPASVRGVVSVRTTPLPPCSSVRTTPLPPPPPDPEGGELRSRMQRYEAEIIAEALRAAGGKRAAAARQLGMPLRTLAHKIKVLGLQRDDGEG